MKRTIFIFLVSVFISVATFAQADLLQSGPMVGYSDFREALIWVQTKAPADVKIGYFAQGEKERFTKTVSTTEEGDYIAKLYPSDVAYGTTYTYKLYLNDQLVPRLYPLEFQTQTLWQYRTDPPPFTFAIGSCFYRNEPKDDRPGRPYGDAYGIFESIVQKDPDFMVWLGDNIYLRTPDFQTERGIRHRNRQARATPELQALLGSVHHYAIWDDHDYGPNDSDRSYVHKKIAEKAFNEYWGNPSTNATGEGGITGQFVWNDVEFFLMDDRYHRAPNRSLDSAKDYLGDVQLNWLIDALTASKASFKIVCIGGQTISDAAVYENYATYPEARKRLLDRIAAEKIEGVVFMSGDRHHTEISRLERPDAYPLIDITCSPLTSGTHKARDEGNTLQVKDKTYYERNFGLVNVSGAYGERTLLLTIYDQKGQKVWDYSIAQQELRYKK
ncbi:alkaline phosphatase [Dokdonia pacifica]|uniref:Alkaline phosphatase D n=1 Tax=Dokdonia pacifica TaxID=1627892 RepID=A0A238W3D3_9FLAO|nr:alkaline phosphatase D family protein [Dokdonia pacifica]GGG15584.1 alkaline phosphatase [Dokdonia pacifica]SNR40673.1 alkaline phosphatase D [Dokdonia pacifica]